jgi:hypothetical protein
MTHGGPGGPIDATAKYVEFKVLGMEFKIPIPVVRTILIGIVVFALGLSAVALLFPTVIPSIRCQFSSGNCPVVDAPGKARFPNATNYTAERGYTESNRPSPNDQCRALVAIPNVTVKDGEIRFRTDDRTWVGSIRQTDGYITVNNEGISPRTRTPTSIQGYYTGAALKNEFCGRGFFKLHVPGS